MVYPEQIGYNALLIPARLAPIFSGRRPGQDPDGKSLPAGLQGGASPVDPVKHRPKATAPMPPPGEHFGEKPAEGRLRSPLAANPDRTRTESTRHCCC